MSFWSTCGFGLKREPKFFRVISWSSQGESLKIEFVWHKLFIVLCSTVFFELALKSPPEVFSIPFQPTTLATPHLQRSIRRCLGLKRWKKTAATVKAQCAILLWWCDPSIIMHDDIIHTNEHWVIIGLTSSLLWARSPASCSHKSRSIPVERGREKPRWLQFKIWDWDLKFKIGIIERSGSDILFF